MNGDNAPFDGELGENDEDPDDFHKLMEKRSESLKNMSSYERKLMKGLMRGFGNTMILWLISQKKQHGYEIMTKLHDSSPLETKMPSASKIYPVLHDLEKHGLIEGSWGHQGKRKIKYYEITEEGKKTLSTFRELAQIAKRNKSNLWLDFMKDMLVEKED